MNGEVLVFEFRGRVEGGNRIVGMRLKGRLERSLRWVDKEKGLVVCWFLGGVYIGDSGKK